MLTLPIFDLNRVQSEMRNFDILKRAKAKYVLGLTGTPIRRNGHQPIIVIQCGPTRHTVPMPSETPIDLAVIPHLIS
jgi:superfamily II DNA or RNA helicase